MILFKSYIFLLCFSFFTKLNSKDYDTNSFICADEIGPSIEFKIPNFNKINEKKISFKIFKNDDRTQKTIEHGKIKKLSHPIDYTYNYYVISHIKNDVEINKYIEFYPPSHLLIRKQENQYESLFCWVPEGEKY